MAIENVPFKEAQEIMQKRVYRNREEINRGRENNREERSFSWRIVERGWGHGNNDVNEGGGNK